MHPWTTKSVQKGVYSLTLLHSERPKLYAVLAFMGAIALEKELLSEEQIHTVQK